MPDSKQTIRRFYEEFVNENRDEVMDELVAEDVVDHEEPPVPLPEGREGVRQWFQMMRAAFPDMHMEALDMIEQGDKLVARAKMTGTHTGEFMGMPPSGKRFE